MARPGRQAPGRPRLARVGAEHLALLLALLAGATAVRMVGLGHDPLWIDEAATLGIAHMPWDVILGRMAEEESNPPGYYALVKLVGAVFGGDLAVLRMVSVAAGVAALLPLWWLGRVGFGARAGWVAAGLLAVAGMHVRLSQDARVYGVLFLVVALAVLAAHRLAVRARSGGRGLAPALALGAAMAAGLWLHPTAALVAVSLNAFVLAATGRARLADGLRWVLLADAVALALAVVPIGAALAHVFDPAGYVDRWIARPGLWATAELYGRSLVAPFLGWPGLAVLGLQLVLLGAAARAWWRERSPLAGGLAAMLAAGAVLLPLVSQFRPVLLERTALFLLVPLLLLLGEGAQHLPRRAAAVVVGALVLLGGAGVAEWHAREHRKERWDQVAALLAERLRPGDPVVLTEGVFAQIALGWHLRRIGVVPPRMVVVVPTSEMEELAAAQLAGVAATEPEALCPALARASGTFLVMRHLAPPVRADADFSRREEVRAALRRAGGQVTLGWTVPGIDVEYWSVPGCP